ncbi:MAG: TfoX/Sxy family protein [Gemmatimonadota bacterium]|nr:TfoX/Sxy family protein [Gemmatimonadota bacterium]
MSAEDRSFVEWIVERLDPLGDVRSRRMFGAWGLYRGDTFFAIVDDGRLFLKTDERTQGRFESRGSNPFQASERQTLRRYWEVPAEVLEDEDALVEWAIESARAARGEPSGEPPGA